MKKFIGILAAILFALPLSAQTFVAQSGITLAVSQSATATYTSGAVRLPNFNAAGVLTVVESGITGSPSGCTEKLYFQTNAGGATSVISTTNITPSTGTQTFTIAPSIAAGDNIYLVYACSSTYPTTGTFTATLSPTAGSVSVTGTPNSNLTQVAGSTLGAIANYGTSPGAVLVPAVNSYVTNTPAVTGSGTFTTSPVNTPGTTDPCQNPSLLKTSVAVNISGAAGTTQLVAPSGSTAVYPCYFTATVVGTAPTILFEYGTSTVCTGTHALTGTLAVVTTSTVTINPGGTWAATPASQGFCLVAGGTTPSIQGVFTYVQQ